MRKSKMVLKNRIIGLLVVCVLLLGLSATAVAGNETVDAVNFTLYAYQGDWESDPVARATNNNTFYMGIYTMSRDGVKARVWTESLLGTNFSDPYGNTVGAAEGKYYNYDTKPSIGTNVVLNMDASIYLSYSVTGVGLWSPY